LKKNGRGPGLEKLPKILESPFNKSAKAEARNFKFGMQLGFAKTHNKITQRKSGSGSGLGKLPKILGFPLIFLQRLKLANSNLVRSLSFQGPS